MALEPTSNPSSIANCPGTRNVLFAAYSPASKLNRLSPAKPKKAHNNTKDPRIQATAADFCRGTPAANHTTRKHRGTFSIGLIASGVAACGAVWAYLKKKEMDREKESVVEDDPTAYLMALARTRQAIHVQNAIGFNFANVPVRTMVELERAMKENAKCRSPILKGSFSIEELQGVYSKYIQNSEMPPDYAALLQLRNMLGISADDADRIEQAALGTDFFSI